MSSRLSPAAKRQRFSLARLLPAICVAVLAIALHLAGGWLTPAQSQSASPAPSSISSPAPSAGNTSSYSPLKAISANAQQVKTGIYAVNLYNLDPSSNTYYLDFYAWFKWKGDIDPIANLEFTNGVEDWGLTQVPGYEEPKELPDGSMYQIARVEGRFVQPFTLARYPLDQQTLHVTIENSVYPIDQLVYDADQVDSGFSEDLSIPGWKIKNFQLQSLEHRYQSKFGLPASLAESSIYSALRYELQISRPVSFFIWKLLLPLVIVLISSWGAFILNPHFVDSRILMPVTALLTTVFLQQSYSAALPDVGYLVLLDKIYALAYILIIAAILEAIITADWIRSEKIDDEERVIKLDRLFLIVQFILLIGGVTLLIWL